MEWNGKKKEKEGKEEKEEGEEREREKRRWVCSLSQQLGRQRNVAEEKGKDGRGRIVFAAAIIATRHPLAHSPPTHASPSSESDLMQSSDSGQRPTRAAASRAVLAIRADALDGLQEGEGSKADLDHSNAFARIMSSRPTPAPAAKPSRLPNKRTPSSAAKSNTAPYTVPDIDFAAISLVPDLEDLVADAARVRISERHPQSYHRFTLDSTRKRIHNDLLAWYDVHHRKLPWRRDFDKATSSEDQPPGQRAYEVWVSEIMCQQTQVATVIPYYNTWMSKWPTIADLAAADLEEVNKVWTGLGYYSRASRLHSGAQKVVKDFGGVLPR